MIKVDESFLMEFQVRGVTDYGRQQKILEPVFRAI